MRHKELDCLNGKTVIDLFKEQTTKDKSIMIRCSSSEKEQWEKVAKMTQAKSFNDFVRRILNEVTGG